MQIDLPWLDKMSAVETALEFVKRINSADSDQMAEIMTEDHTFIDADGSHNSGCEKMRKGWKDYFSMVPDFTIKIHESFARGNSVALFGTAEGTFIDRGELKSENHWQVSSAWRCEVRENKVAVWQVYVNYESIVRIHQRINPE